MNELVSVIIPVYNTAAYLRECLDSILNQTYKNLEIIIINDGSTDNSYEICKDYEKKDNRVILINSKNEGVSATRNKGIEKANGTYLTFVDSDDVLNLNFIETLMQSNNSQNDIIIANYACFTQELTQTKPHEVIYKDERTFMNFITKNFLWEPWGKLVKKDIINKKFRTDVYIAEDALFWCENDNNCTFKYVDFIGYYYRENPNSVMKNKTVTQKVLKEFDALDEIIGKTTEESRICFIEQYIDKAYLVKKSFLDNEKLFKNNKSKIISNAKKYCNQIEKEGKISFKKMFKLKIKTILL